MKLTDEQRKMVEENHNMIYWFMQRHNLELDYWYDILAIALCECIPKYDPEKSKISTFIVMYFKHAVGIHFKRLNAKKRFSNLGTTNIDDVQLSYDEDFMEQINFNDFMDKNRDNEFLQLKLKGYNQTEIGNKMNMSQANVSRKLLKLKREYDSYDR